MEQFSVVAVVLPAHEAGLDAFLASLASQTIGLSRLEVLLVDDGAGDPARARIADWQRSRASVHRVGRASPSPTIVDETPPFAAAVGRASAPWVALCDASAPLPPDHFERLAAFIRRHDDPALLLVCGTVPATAGSSIVPVGRMDAAPEPWHRCVLRRDLLSAAALRPDARLRPDLAAESLVWRLLSRATDQVVGQARSAKNVRIATAEPPAAVWRDPATYDGALQHGFIEPLEEAAQMHGRVPRWLQVAVLQQLHWYFTIDLRERAPTVAVTESMAAVFHDRVRQIMRLIDADSLDALDPQQVSPDVRHALLSYHGRVLHSTVVLDAYDHDQSLARVRYYVHGEPPPETFLIDGTAVAHAYAKYRACRFFRRTLLRQRIVWLPAAGAVTLDVMLNNASTPVTVGRQAFAGSGGPAQPPPLVTAGALLSAVRSAYPPGKGGQLPLPPGWAGWKVRLLRALAQLPPVRWRFAKAWVFTDREEDADDNAEHLYRWVRRHHPAINAWFLLSRSSHDWPRLAAEGFRLVSPGLMRRLLILNSEQIVSSHTEYAFGGLDRSRYGDAMRWRSTFLQHGVIKDDLSHWLGPCEFDRFLTSSPAEHASVVGEDTAYPYTEHEVRRTGLPRYDRLLQIAQRTPPTDVNVLLVMPTWRGSLVDERMAARSLAERMAAFAASDYAQHWRALLRNDGLRALVAQHDQQLVFMPHPNVVPYIDAFDPPAHVQVATAANSVVPQVFARCAGFVTDYTSVAFTMAFLRRPVFYYQFDRDRFYGGDHNWRAGYFDYDRDGFGPVALVEDELMAYLRRFFANGTRADPEYLERMERAMPDRDDQACRRAFESIIELRRPVHVVRSGHEPVPG